MKSQLNDSQPTFTVVLPMLNSFISHRVPVLINFLTFFATCISISASKPSFHIGIIVISSPPKCKGLPTSER